MSGVLRRPNRRQIVFNVIAEETVRNLTMVYLVSQHKIRIPQNLSKQYVDSRFTF